MESNRNNGDGELIADRYQIEGVLGRGGMATVYRVRDRRTDRVCALKRASGSKSRRTQRRASLLEREYHTLAQLAHPRIIEVYEYGVDRRGAYYTMEMLDGGDLQASGRLPWKQACALLYDVASSLAIVHARGLIHRDVSLRNVRCTLEGRAKLIDFGAMMPMGVARDMLGTPPFIAPEVMQMQALDGRSDLFALGAIGYYLLTGRHAFPARKLAELRDIWRSRPVPPVKLIPDVPPALSALIVQLLAIDRAARPRSAAEVMEQLCGIADLPVEEHAGVSRAYLTTPSLVGRDHALVGVRRKILSLVRREGSALLIKGLAGAGRSRMLDACVLEGKVLGVSVARVDAGDAAGGDWSVARSLCNQLVALMPREAAEATRLSRDVLAHVVDSLHGASVTAMQPDRSLLLRELRDFVLTLSRQQKLLLVIDEVDQIDEPSAAFLAAIAHKCERHAVMLVISLESESDGAASAPLRLLRLVAETIELQLLQPDETHGLIGSIFGDVSNLQFVSGHIHALAHGNPRDTMELVRHLVERGLARYQSGSWLLPDHFDEGDLPGTMAEALAERIAKLSRTARTFVQIQAVADGEHYTAHDYAALTGVHDQKTMYAALDELLSERVLIADRDRYRFSLRGFVPVIRNGLTEQQSKQFHARIADRLQSLDGDLLVCADHLLHAGRSREAVELLCSVDLQMRSPTVELLERAIESAEKLQFSRSKVHQLRGALLSRASVALDEAAFRRCLPVVLAQLERDSGLALYRELSDLPEDTRLAQALARTQERYAATPEAERVYAVVDAIRELARLSGALCSFAAQVTDLQALESLPSLQPFRPMSPALEVVANVIEATQGLISGRHEQHIRASAVVLERIALADRGGLDAAQHRRTQLGVHYMLALVEASFGDPGVEKRIALLEEDREYRVQAWRLRMVMHRCQGNVDEARRCERRAELLQLQERSQQAYLGTAVASEVIVAADTGDVIGVKSCLNALARLGERYPGWRPMLAYGQARYRALQGDLQGALDLVHPVLEQMVPGRNNTYVLLAGTHVRVLADLGRVEEAVACGRRYFEIIRRERLGGGSEIGLAIALSQALAATGEYDEAIRTIENTIDSSRSRTAGFSLGVLYETRVRIATQMGDRASFDRFIELCASEYKKAHNPALAARVARLIEEASQRDITADRSSTELQELLQEPGVDETEYNTVHSRMFECVDGGDRARCALSLLLQSTESAFGLLYGMRAGAAVLLAALPEVPVDADITAWVEESLLAASSTDVVETEDSDGEEADVTRSSAILDYVDDDGRKLEVVMMSVDGSEPGQIAAALVLDVTSGVRMLPPRQLLQELARELLEHGDIGGA